MSFIQSYIFLFIIVTILLSAEVFIRSTNRIQIKNKDLKTMSFDFISILIGEQNPDYTLELIRGLSPSILPLAAMAYFSASIERQISATKEDGDKQIIANQALISSNIEQTNALIQTHKDEINLIWADFLAKTKEEIKRSTAND